MSHMALADKIGLHFTHVSSVNAASGASRWSTYERRQRLGLEQLDIFKTAEDTNVRPVSVERPILVRQQRIIRVYVEQAVVVLVAVERALHAPPLMARRDEPGAVRPPVLPV